MELCSYCFACLAGDCRSGYDSPIALGAVEMASLPLVLAGGWAEAEAFAHALPESFPLFGRHVLAALGHSPPIIGAMKATTTNASEQNPAESQQSDSLPEGNLPP